MERRLQLLLDQRRFRRVSEEAERSGRSVAAVIREAIDFRFPTDDNDERRRAAAAELLAMTASGDPDPVLGPEEFKRAREESLIAKADSW